MATRIITPVVILSYPHLDKPAKNVEGNTGPEKYSAALVFTSEADLASAKAAAEEAFAAAVPDPAKRASLRKGVNFKPGIRTDVEGKYDSVGGVAFINARSDAKPGAVYAFPDPNSPTGAPMRVPEDKYAEVFYAGAKVRASVTAFYFSKAGNSGIGWALNNIQKVGDGDRLDSRKAAHDEFTATDDAPTADIGAHLV